MAEIRNPHDAFFKRLFGDLETATDFMRNYLPPGVVALLNLATLTLEKESFIDPRLRSHFSDLLFRVKLVTDDDLYIYLLVEHKSAPDPWVAFQLLRYIVRIWERLFEAGCETLPMILPIVFYHGEDRWNVSRDFRKLVKAAELAELQKYVPNFEYDLRDVSVRSGVEIVGQARLRAGLELLRHIFSADLDKRVPDIFRNLREMNRADAIEYVESLVAYLSNTSREIKEEVIVEAMNEAFPVEELGTVAPFARTWIARWLAEGKQEGASSLTLRQVRHRFPQVEDATLAQIRSLSMEQLEEFGEALLDFTSLDDLHEWLAEKSSPPQVM
jgi:predicted transposase/invertase (TIGR01784 family)